jgi:hypothetical protein
MLVKVIYVCEMGTWVGRGSPIQPWLTHRVTRLGEVFTLESFLKITEEYSPIFGVIFSQLILTKKWLGFILDDFLANSSGHPAHA